MLFSCATYRDNRITHLHFIAILQSVRKEIKAPVAGPMRHKKKRKKLKRNFERPNLANGCCEFNQICCVAYPTWQTIIMQKWCALEKGPWSYACMKKLFSFFLSIYSWCGVPALLAA